MASRWIGRKAKRGRVVGVFKSGRDRVGDDRDVERERLDCIFERIFAE
jgi:hypothetical protein